MDDYQDDDYDDVIDDSCSELVTCPECGDDIYEDAEQCPLCGTYIVHQHSPWAKRPLWWVALGLLGVISVIITLCWGF
jgi:predicted amidophosphoribosyltransferase